MTPAPPRPPAAEPAFAVLWQDGQRAVTIEAPPTGGRIGDVLRHLGLEHSRDAIVLALGRYVLPQELLVFGERHPAVRRRIVSGAPPPA